MAGRPPKFQTPEELNDKINEFLMECNEKGIHPTKGQLALYLDTTRETLSDYEKKEGYSDAIKRIYGIIEEHWVQQLANKQSVAGIIFYLKNAYSRDWRDKNETDITTQGDKINGVIMLPQRNDGTLATSEEK